MEIKYYRCRNVPVEQSICKSYKVLDDEYNLFFHCKINHEKRILFNAINKIDPQFQKNFILNPHLYICPVSVNLLSNFKLHFVIASGIKYLFVCFRLVSCVSNIASVSRLSIYDYPFLLSNVCLF